MRVLMLGWEFPPHLSGGLGTACLGLTRALAGLDADITFVLPTEASTEQAAHLRLLGAAPVPAHGGGTVAAPASDTASTPVSSPPAPGVTMHAVPSAITTPYPDGGEPLPAPEGLREWLNNPDGAPVPAAATPVAGAAPAAAGARNPYAGDLLAEASAYAARCVALVQDQSLDFDVIHAHDWPTFPAAAALAAATGKPWVAHVHSLESDRAGGVYQVNPQIDAIEREGICGADAVIAVSRRTGDLIFETCGIPADRLSVIYNGVDLFDAGVADATAVGSKPAAPPALPDTRSQDEKIVLFLGRITAQKGPGYFLDAAKRVLEKFDRVRFVIAGTGDQSHELVARAGELGITDHVLFTGFLGADDVDRVFRIADLYVMPSVSEPFGIAPLEAIQHDVPVIISKQSGVSEVLEHVLKVDFWDTDDLASKMLAVLRNPSLADTLRANAGQELRRLNWREAAEQCIGVYASLKS